jgi:hypothetical protein
MADDTAQERPVEIRAVLLDDAGLVRVSGTLTTAVENQSVVEAVEDVIGAGATSVTLDLADVDFAGVELVSALSARRIPSSVMVSVLRPPKTMLLAIAALRMRGRLHLPEGPPVDR